MKRSLLIFGIIFWILIAVFLLGGMVFGMVSGNQFFNFSSMMEVRKEQRFDSLKITTLQVDTLYAVKLEIVDTQEFKVTEYESDRTREEDLFQAEQSGSTLIIRKKNWHINVFNFGSFFGEKKLVIQIPRTYADNVDIQTTSGGITLLHNATWRKVRLHSTSGGIDLHGALTANEAAITSTSGGIRVSAPLDVSGSLNCESTSGGIRTNDMLTANELRLKSTSGGIHINAPLKVSGTLDCDNTSGGIKMNDLVTAKTLNMKSTSGDIRLQEIDAAVYDIHGSSGSIRIEAISGSGSISANSGGVRAKVLNLTGDSYFKSSSGDVHVTLTHSVRFQLRANSNSGGVHANFDLRYTDRGKNSAEAVIGEDSAPALRLQSNSGSIQIKREE